LGLPIRGKAGATIGIICAISRRPIKTSPEAIEVMELMAVKAGAEIERAARAGLGA